MALDLPVYKQRRVVLVRFRRAGSGDPDAARPDIDDRGWADPDRGPVVGMVAGSTITVRLRRERIAATAPLHAISSDPASLIVTDPATFLLPGKEETDVALTAVIGGNPKVARLEIRHGTAAGPVIHRLTVRIFTKLTVKVTPHNVTITGNGMPGVASAVTIATIMDKVKAIWKPCGIDFNVQATKAYALDFANAGILQASVFDASANEVWGPEIATLLSGKFVPSTINAYFVNQIAMMTNPGLLGLGISRATSTAAGAFLPKPGIILGDQNANGSNRSGDAMWLANDLAHEIGHFFQLWHPDKKEPPLERKDTWSRRMLMHNLNSMDTYGGWKDTVVGYGSDGNGSPRRGCLVTMKDLSQITTDGECATARATISSAAGPY